MSPTPAISSEDNLPPDPRTPLFGGPDFPRSVQSEGVSKSGRPREVETTRQHVRLALENWEKQFADVLRYERAQVQDDANKAARGRAWTRSGAALALAVTALSPVATNSADLQKIGEGPTNLGNGLTLLGGLSLATCVASIWWAGYLTVLRRRFEKARTAPKLPPERLDARQVVAIIESPADVPYYRERDIDPGDRFGWKPGEATPPQMQDDPPPEQASGV